MSIANAITDIAKRYVPSRAANAAIGIELSVVAVVALGGLREVATLVQPSLSPESLRQLQLWSLIGTFAVMSFFCFVMMIVEYRRLERSHAEEIERLKSAPGPAMFYKEGPPGAASRRNMWR